jgi:hypothetical protein
MDDDGDNSANVDAEQESGGGLFVEISWSTICLIIPSNSSMYNKTEKNKKRKGQQNV